MVIYSIEMVVTLSMKYAKHEIWKAKPPPIYVECEKTSYYLTVDFGCLTQPAAMGWQCHFPAENKQAYFHERQSLHPWKNTESFKTTCFSFDLFGIDYSWMWCIARYPYMYSASHMTSSHAGTITTVSWNLVQTETSFTSIAKLITVGIRPWISDHIHIKPWEVFTDPCHKFNGSLTA